MLRQSQNQFGASRDPHPSRHQSPEESPAGHLQKAAASARIDTVHTDGYVCEEGVPTKRGALAYVRTRRAAMPRTAQRAHMVEIVEVSWTARKALCREW